MTESRAVDHACHFWDDDTGLSTMVAGFFAPAFDSGHGILSIGTRAHIAAIEQRLRTDGHDVDDARERGRYVTVDAERAPSRLMRNGLPTPETFDDVIGNELRRLASEYANVRVFGEVVNVLWRQGKRAAALRLEEIWDESLDDGSIALVCGYAMRSFRQTTEAPGLRGIVDIHTNVVT